MKKFKMAVLQLNTQENKAEKLQQVSQMIDEAAEKGAQLVALPEVFNVIDLHKTPPEEIPGGESSQMLIEAAKRNNVYIHGGSFLEKVDGSEKKYNTSIFISPNGEILGRYEKLHLFDVDLPDGKRIRESDRNMAGRAVVNCETSLANFGFAICYDIRFPELFRLLALRGAEVIFTPANFTMPTGKDHWECILRTRAIENGVYIVAPAQIGVKANFTAFGASMIIDPWGTVIARAPERECIIYGEIDLEYLEKVRYQIPSLRNRRADIYNLEYIGE